MSAASCGMFTDLPLDEIDRLAALGGAEINEAKKVLATEATGAGAWPVTPAAAAADTLPALPFETGDGGRDPADPPGEPAPQLSRRVSRSVPPAGWIAASAPAWARHAG